MVGEISADLMRINPDNPYSSAGKAFLLAYRGIKNTDDANQFVEAMENAIKHSDLEAKIHLWNELGLLMERFGSRVYTKAQDQKERIYHIVDALGDYNQTYRSYPKLEEFYVARDNHKANEHDHSVTILKSPLTSRPSVKPDSAFFSYKDEVKRKNGYYSNYHERRRKDWMLIFYLVAAGFIGLGILFAMVEVSAGLLVILLGVLMGLFGGTYYRK